MANAVEGAQLVAIAHAGSHELRLTERGPVEIHHEVGFIDAMTSSEVSLATGLGQWAAGRKVGLAEALAGRFTKLLGKVITGELATVNAGKVVTACDGLDPAACAAVEDVLVERLVGMDPARITTVARKVATRIAADQVAAATAKNKKDRAVQVTPGPDGTTDWWARLPAGRSAAAWAAIRDLGRPVHQEGPQPDPGPGQGRRVHRPAADQRHRHRQSSPSASRSSPAPTPSTPERPPSPNTQRRTRPATVPQAPAPTAEPPAKSPSGGDQEGSIDTAEGTAVADGGCGANTPEADASWVRPAVATGGLGLGGKFSLSAALLSGCEIPGIGFIDADTVQALLSVVPTDIGRALLDARTGTLMETVTTAYRPSKAVTDFVTTRDGTCRMWGCPRPASECDIDHARPWPTGPTTPTNLGGLCRRHHRLKQRRRWTYQLAPDGTATWTSPTGTTRITQPDHAVLPPPPPQPPVPRRPPERPERELVDRRASPVLTERQVERRDPDGVADLGPAPSGWSSPQPRHACRTGAPR